MNNMNARAYISMNYRYAENTKEWKKAVMLKIQTYLEAANRTFSKADIERAIRNMDASIITLAGIDFVLCAVK